MSKFVLFFTSFIFLCFDLTAQNKPTTKQKASAGVKTGINISRFRLDGKIAGVLESNFRTGFVAGAFVNLPFGRSPFSIQPEFLYSSMGGDNLGEQNDKHNYRFNYFSIPLLFKYGVTKKITALAGPQLDYIIYAKETNFAGEFNITRDLEEFDWLTTWGLEWWPWKNIPITGRYMHGFRKVYHIDNVSANNRGFQLTIGLRFHKPPPLPAQVVVTPTVVSEKDSDGDGILDSKDKCPTVAGFAKYEGCPIPDTDKDGIHDEEDKCPEVVGYPELNGCPYPDRDKDGVTDNKDRCPDEPGSTKNDGCPITDRDNDGVPDDIDRCPDTPGPASNYGCPEDVKTKLTYIAKNIYFHTNKATLQQISHDPLDQLVDILKRYPNATLVIEGHTDNTGSNAYNIELSENRANAVKNYLTGKGIDGSRLTATGYGEEKPVTTNNTAEGRKLNRRVELKLSE